MKNLRSILFTVGLMAMFVLSLIPKPLGSPPMASHSSYEPSISQPIAPANPTIPVSFELPPATVTIIESPTSASGFEATSTIGLEADVSPPAEFTRSLT